MAESAHNVAGTATEPADRLERRWQQGERPDVSAFLANAGTLTPGQVVAVLRVDQCGRWENGERPPAEAYLAMRPDVFADQEAALELIYGEFLLREDRGEAVAAEFLRRFPRYATRLRQQLEVHQAIAEQETTSAGPAALRASQPGGRFSRYRIVKLLGQGGMGTVYHAHDTQLDRPVALKVIRVGRDHAETVERFNREARIAASFTHPNLCPVYDFDQADGHYYLTMPLLPGEPLSAMLTRDGPLRAPTAARLVALIAHAVHEAHRAGVIHRDLKPANVMMSAGQPVVLDFGLARRVDGVDPRITRPGAVLGTPAYMPPEQIAGDTEAGPAVDIYSLGMILYEMLTGRLPYEGTAAQMLAQALAGNPPPPSRYRPALDADLERICLKAIARIPAERYPSMAAFAAALESWDGLARHASRRSGVRTAPLHTRSRAVPYLAWVGCLLLGMTATAVGMTLWWVWPRPDATQAVQGVAIPVEGHPDDIAKDAITDAFAVGSRWTGTHTWENTGYGRPVLVEVKDRTGERFGGVYTADDGDYIWKIAGTIKGGDVEWAFTEMVHEREAKEVVGIATVHGVLKSDTWFEGEFRGSNARAKTVLKRRE